MNPSQALWKRMSQWPAMRSVDWPVLLTLSLSGSQKLKQGLYVVYLCSGFVHFSHLQPSDLDGSQSCPMRTHSTLSSFQGPHAHSRCYHHLILHMACAALCTYVPRWSRGRPCCGMPNANPIPDLLAMQEGMLDSGRPYGPHWSHAQLESLRPHGNLRSRGCGLWSPQKAPAPSGHCLPSLL